MVHKTEMLFFKASCTQCNLKTDKQYATNGNYTVTIQSLYAQTKLNYEMYALKF